jgi:glycogen debranching enzyme
MRWLSAISKEGKIAAGVEMDGKQLSFGDWDDMLQRSFEKVFYIPENPDEDRNYSVQPELVHMYVYWRGLGGEMSLWPQRALSSVAWSCFGLARIMVK